MWLLYHHKTSNTKQMLKNGQWPTAYHQREISFPIQLKRLRNWPNIDAEILLEWALKREKSMLWQLWGFYQLEVDAVIIIMVLPPVHILFWWYWRSERRWSIKFVFPRLIFMELLCHRFQLQGPWGTLSIKWKPVFYLDNPYKQEISFWNKKEPKWNNV